METLLDSQFPIYSTAIVGLATIVRCFDEVSTAPISNQMDMCSAPGTEILRKRDNLIIRSLTNPTLCCMSWLQIADDIRGLVGTTTSFRGFNEWHDHATADLEHGRR